MALYSLPIHFQLQIELSPYCSPGCSSKRIWAFDQALFLHRIQYYRQNALYNRRHFESNRQKVVCRNCLPETLALVKTVIQAHLQIVGCHICLIRVNHVRKSTSVLYEIQINHTFQSQLRLFNLLISNANSSTLMLLRGYTRFSTMVSPGGTV